MSSVSNIIFLHPYLCPLVVFLSCSPDPAACVCAAPAGGFRVYHCNWLVPAQKASVESCIKVLSDVGEYLTVTSQTVHKWISCSSISIYLYIRSSTKNLSHKEMISPFCCIKCVCNRILNCLFLAKSRAIAIPVDLDSQVNNLFREVQQCCTETILNWRISARNASRRDSTLTTSKDYRNIIERLQVRAESPENSQWRNVFALALSRHI